MRYTDLLIRSLRHYWRTNLAVVLGVATAVTVLGGALLVGDSVRGSLRDLVLQRLGSTDFVVSSPQFFTGDLASISADPEFGTDFTAIARLIVLPAVATGQETGRRAGRVTVYGVEPDFWTFHGRSAAMPPMELGAREAFLSESLAREIGVTAGGTRTPARPAAVRHPVGVAARAEGRRRPHHPRDGPRGAAAVGAG